MPTPAPLADPPPTVEQLLDVLAVLGRSATVTAGSPRPQTTLHLARLLVAVAERHAISAELAAGRAGLDVGELDVEEHQGTYDTATVRATFERLALVHWRARRLTATVTTLREAMLGARDLDEDDDPSGMAPLWNLAAHTTIAADAILAVLARLVTPPVDDIAAAVDRLDAATALLVHVGESAAELRASIGMDQLDDGPASAAAAWTAR
jgi:hypothetical protein